MTDMTRASMTARIQSWADDEDIEQREEYTEDLTPEGIQLGVPGAERIEPTKRDPQGKLW